MKRRRAGARSHMVTYQNPRRNLDPRVAAALFTTGGPAPRMPAYVPLSAVSFMVVQHHGGLPCLKDYRLEPRLATDGVVRIGPETLDGLYNLRLRYQDRLAAGYLSPSRLPLETRVAAKASGLLQMAADRDPSVRPHPTPPTPAVAYGYAAPLPLVRSPALAELARTRAGAEFGFEPTEEQLAAAWAVVPEVFEGDGGRQFVYPARFVLPDRRIDHVAHPMTGEPRPEAAGERPGVQHRGWVYRDGEWTPCIPPGARAWLVGAKVAGRECENPAFSVLRDYNFVDESGTLSDLLADSPGLDKIRQCLLEMPPAARAELGENMRRRLRAGVFFTDDDVFRALLDPGEPIRAAEEPQVFVFRAPAGPLATDGWDVDLSTLPRRCNPILGVVDDAVPEESAVAVGDAAGSA